MSRADIELDFNTERINFYENPAPKKGSLLIASPTLQDPNFKRTILLLCEHDEEGSFALVLNRSLQMSLGDAMNQVSGWDSSLNQGGPVQTNTLQFIHNQVEAVDGTELITQQLAWGGKFDDLGDMIASQETPGLKYKFFIGYSGWASGQLDIEIEQKSWFVTELDEDLIFSGEGTEAWREALCKLGKKYSLLLNYPENLGMN